MQRDRRGRARADSRRRKTAAQADRFGGQAPAHGTTTGQSAIGSQFRALWILVGLVGLAVLVYVHLTGGPHHLLKFHRDADKIEHVVAFAAAMLWFGQLYRRELESTLFCICLMLSGVALEYLQHALGHYDPVEYGDMAADALGACLGLLLLRTRMADFIANLDRWLASWAPARRSDADRSES